MSSSFLLTTRLSLNWSSLWSFNQLKLSDRGQYDGIVTDSKLLKLCSFVAYCQFVVFVPLLISLSGGQLNEEPVYLLIPVPRNFNFFCRCFGKTGETLSPRDKIQNERLDISFQHIAYLQLIFINRPFKCKCNSKHQFIFHSLSLSTSGFAGLAYKTFNK